jgi:competence protein ComEC
MQSLMRGIDVREVLVGENLEPPSLRSTVCRADAKWDWDGIRFKILHPRNRIAWEGNNLSCVLLVSVADHRILLTGDIEAPVEILLEYRSVLSDVSVVLVPHHGSRTSSSHALVNTLRPQLAIVAAGFANRWGMPKEDVVQRWQKSGARVVNTAYSGAISQRLCSGQPAGRVQRERPDSLRYWHDDPGDTH